MPSTVVDSRSTLVSLLEHYNVPTSAFTVALDREIRAIDSEYLATILGSLNDVFLHNPSSRLAGTSVVFSILLNSENTWTPEIEQSGFHISLTHSMILDQSPSLFLMQAKLLSTLLCQSPGRMSPRIPQILVIFARSLCWRQRSGRKIQDDGGSFQPGSVPRLTPADFATSKDTSASSFLHSQMELILDPLPELGWTTYTSSEAWHAPSSILASPMLHDPAVQGLSSSDEAAAAGGPVSEGILTLLKPLYAFWPENLTAFIRQPDEYVAKHDIKCPFVGGWRSMWGLVDLRVLAKPLLKDFSFNPSSFTRDEATELALQSKFTKMEPSETVATAESFYIPSRIRPSTATISRPNLLHDEDSSRSLRSQDGSEDGWRDRKRSDSALSERERERGMALGIGFGGGGRGTQPIQIGGPGGMGQDAEALVKQNETLRLELQLSRKMGELYLQHVHRLHKVASAVSNDQAELQVMFNKIREWRAKTEAAEKEVAELKAEKDRSSQANTKWTERQRAKYNDLRAEKRATEGEQRALKARIAELEESLVVKERVNATIEHAKLELDAENKTLRQDIKHINQYKQQIALYEENQRLWDEDVRKYKEMKRSLENMQSNWVQMEYMIVSCNRDRVQLSEQIRKHEETILRLKDEALARPAQRPTVNKADEEKLAQRVHKLEAIVRKLQDEMELLRRQKLDAEALVEELSFADKAAAMSQPSLLA